MRSRPDLELVYWPAQLRPGDEVHFEARLVGQSNTPVTAVRFRFRGLEARQLSYGEDGPSLHQHTHFDLRADSGPLELKANQHRKVAAKFQLPWKLPPSFHGPASLIDYRLDVRVDIPWWPDRTASFAIPVRPGPGPPQVPTGPKSFSSAPQGPRGKELQIEVALDRTRLEPGETLSGAVSVDNLERRPVRRLEVSLVAIDDAPDPSPIGPKVALRTDTVVLSEGEPRAGQTYPFQLQVPREALPSFVSTHVQLRWQVAVRAVLANAEAAELAPEIQVVVPRGDGGAGQKSGRSTPSRTAPLGRQRRSLVWAEVAYRTGLSCDEANEHMSAQFGPVALQIALELRGERLWSVASLEWPGLGLDLRLTERRWSDVFRDAVPLGDPGFDRRFAARGRTPEQVRAVFTEVLRGQLWTFHNVNVDDDGADLAAPGNGYTLEELEPFVRAVVAAATALRATVERVPAPPGLEPHRDAWQAFALKHGGRFEAGCFAVRDARYRDAPVELLTRFDDLGVPTASVARVLLAKPRSPRAKLPAETRRLVKTLAAECQGLEVTSDAVEATLPSPLAEPVRAESLWRPLQRLARTLE